MVFEPRRGDDCHCGPERDLCDPGRWFRSLGEKQFKSLVGDPLNAVLKPGDSIVVPEKPRRSARATGRRSCRPRR